MNSMLSVSSPNSGPPSLTISPWTHRSTRVLGRQLQLSPFLRLECGRRKEDSSSKRRETTHRCDVCNIDQSSQSARPIIMKFVSYQDRRAVFGRKKNLKGRKIVLTENLTKRRAELLGKARAKAGVKATWTADGRIICLLEDGRKIAIDTARDLSDRIA